jgi:hypothetical protein
MIVNYHRRTHECVRACTCTQVRGFGDMRLGVDVSCSWLRV